MCENLTTMSKVELIADYQFRHDIKILKGAVLELSPAKAEALKKAGLVKGNASKSQEDKK